MKKRGFLKRLITQMGLIAMIGGHMSANAGFFDHTKGWSEEVLLYDGRVLLVSRHFNLGGYPTVDARERALLDETLTFTLPDSKKKIFWKTEYRNDSPEPNSLDPLLLGVVDGVVYLATSPAGCIAYNKWGRPNPPYIFFKYVDDQWKRIPLEEFPPVLVRTNLMSTPDSRLLKSHYTVEEAQKQIRERNVAEIAKTILREPIPEAQLCPDWNSERYRSFRPPLPIKPANEK